jgi:hypothetical protein
MLCSVAGTTTLISININKDENKSLISNQFSLKNDFLPFLGELFCGGKK